MNSWNDGYFTESTYTYGYYREINPVFQKFCLLVNGYAAPVAQDTDNHCELGFGQGVSINIHAAANLGKYFGTDFNPAHAAHANELCNASGCGAHFFDNSFEEMLHRSDLPQFDSISLHGIWSWISTENQNHIVEFARKYLKPGGIFYNSYNCYPGWSPAAPMREIFILHDKYAQKSSKTYERIEEAMKFTAELLEKNPMYFRRVPDVKGIFEGTRKHDHDYLAHEYFNRDWICMYFSEVAEILQDAKLDFACTAEIIEAFAHLTVTSDAQEFLSKIEHPIMREQIKDYFLNRQFRKDIFVRGARKISAYERSQRILDTPFVLLSTSPFATKVNVTIGEIALAPDLCEKIYKYLENQNYRPKTFREFMKKNPDVSQPNLEQLLIILAHTGAISPAQTEDAIRAVKPQCDALNKYFCKHAERASNINQLVSPVLGGGVGANRFDQLFVSAMANGKKSADAIAEEIWGTLRAQGQQIVKQGKVLETPEENLDECKNMAREFLDKRLPIFKALQVV